MSGTLGERLVWRDGTFRLSQCVVCRHKTVGSSTCAAFPEGIPQQILTNAVSHADPHSGDGGVRLMLTEITRSTFEQITGLPWPHADTTS
jgi:hypothetical protein